MHFLPFKLSNTPKYHHKNTLNGQNTRDKIPLHHQTTKVKIISIRPTFRNFFCKCSQKTWYTFHTETNKLHSCPFLKAKFLAILCKCHRINIHEWIHLTYSTQTYISSHFPHKKYFIIISSFYSFVLITLFEFPQKKVFIMRKLWFSLNVCYSNPNARKALDFNCHSIFLRLTITHHHTTATQTNTQTDIHPL